MDFFARQAAARGQSRWLVIAFILSLLAVALALDLVLFTFLASGRAHRPDIDPVGFAAQNPGLAFVSTLLVMGVLGLASLYKSMELRGGGGVVARSLGGVLVDPDTRDAKRKRLLNVVSEMAIASGVPMPEVYVLEQEAAINAFAAGHTPANAAVTVTQGALDRLNRDQLQGVIGHEFSHILNGDMRLNLQLMGWVFGLFVVGLIGRLILNFSPRDRRNNNNAIVVLGLAVMVLGYVGLFFGRLLQAAVSRQRERLADASGVQFTRNPQGLKEALIKIAAMPDGSVLTTPQAEQAAHMFFAEGLSRAFATHPPLLERIRELDPQFDEAEIARVAEQMAAEPSGPSAGAEGANVGTRDFAGTAGAAGDYAGPAGTAPLAQGAAGFAQRAAGSGAPRGSVGGAAPGAVSAAARSPIPGPGAAFANISALAGTLTPAHIQHAQTLHAALPDTIRDFQSPGRAQALVVALLLSKEPAVRQRQFALLEQKLSAGNVAFVRQIAPVVDAIDPMLRLPALQQVFPSLRRVPAAQRRALAGLAADLIHADARIDAFEFSLAKLLETLLNDELEARVPHGTVSLESAQEEINVLFATLAQLGAQDEHSARTAYEAGMSVVLPMRYPEYTALSDWPRQLSEVLPRLERLEPFAKKRLMDGLVKTITSDEVMTEAESELLRTVCAVLHCPLPIFTGFAQQSTGIAQERDPV
ncbi:MAG: M48 family metallopeptidase [Proteobacteria bacterium]|nr:M48 family metallopeptidase [Pseudomonadota bacterium]